MSEQTITDFDSKSEEQIIEWMLKNLTTEQIKTCLDSKADTITQTETTTENKLDFLRRVCANKRYVIDKIEDDTVYFWYYIVKSKKWIYSNSDISNFPKTIDDLDADECGSDTIVTYDIIDDLKETYETTGIEDQVGFKTEWDIIQEQEEQIDVLLTAVEIQKSIKSTPELRSVINFTPVLIESVNQNKVNYYYLRNDGNDLKFTEANLDLDRLQTDFEEVLSDLNLPLLVDSQGSSDAMSPDGWKNVIRQKANEIDSSDLERIKNIYEKYPLSADSPYFMSGLFETSAFGNTYNTHTTNITNNLANMKYSDLEAIIKNKYGTAFGERYKPKKITNENGVKTIMFVPR